MFATANVLGGLVPCPRDAVRLAVPARALPLFRLEDQADRELVAV
jgi:hypothetical protein